MSPNRATVDRASARDGSLFATRNSLPEDARRQVAELLNRRLADAVDLETQCKQAHWNVRGPQFIGLHKLFDEVHEAVIEYTDLIAERIVQLGAVARGTARDAAEQSEVDEYPHSIASGEDHAKALSSALAGFAGRMRFAIAETDELEDPVTADLCTEVSRGTDKWVWMIEAHVQGEAKR
jgi:starvation-inducible DNA-binding protein